MPAVTIYHEDGSTESIPTTTSWRVEREISKMYRLEITVERSLARAVSLTRKRDEVKLDGYARGVLTDVESGDATVTLTVYSPEWYANQAAPTLGGLEVQGTDRELIRGRINTVSEWSEGTLAELTGPMTYVFSHAFQHNALRTIEANVPGELAFAGDGTVDYVDQRGTDRSGSFTLSPAAGNVEGRIRITERGTRLDATHLRVIGAHEGEAQRFANLVPADDPATYENRVNYTTDRWPPDGFDPTDPEVPRDWDTWANKDVMSQDTIEEEAAALGDELTETYVEVEATVSGDALNLGDFIRVVKPEADLDRTMRVHRVVTRSVDGTPAGTVQDVTLSTRTVAREDAAADKRDIQRFNKSFQGSSVAINVGPFRSAVDSGQPISIPFRYPDLEFENTATLQVRGLSYRIDSRGAASGGGAFVTSSSGGVSDDTTASGGSELLTSGSGGGEFLTSGGGGGFSETETSQAQSEHGSPASDSDTGFTSLNGASGWQNIATVSVSTGDVEGMMAGAFLRNADEFEDDIRFRLDAGLGNSFWPDISGTRLSAAASLDSGSEVVPTTGAATAFAPVEEGTYLLQVQYNGNDGEANVAWWYTALGDHSHTVTISRPDHTHSVDIPSHTHSVDIPSHVHEFDWFHDHTVDVPQHTHDPDPGIFTTGDTPSGVDVAVNGSTVATNIGTGTFQTTVDVSGEFTTDAWNTIDLSSDTLGLLQATLFIEGYDQVGKR